MAAKKYWDKPMPPGQFDIVFRGVREGFAEETVQAQFARLFKVDALKTRRLFAAKKVTLKTNIDEPLADKYVARLAAIGVLVDKLAVAPEFHLEKSIPSRVVDSKAIYYRDYGDESCESFAMHQPVEFAYGPEARRIPFVFSANAWDYAKLWFVNVLVCLLSAGLLWPWAQARTQRFFYQHSALDGVEFGYRSRISKVLLIQLGIALAVLCVSLCLILWPIYALPGIALSLGLLPLALSKLQEFQLQNAFYGNNAWHYSASKVDDYLAFLIWPLLLIATAGFAAPWALLHIQRHMLHSRSCGKITFKFTANWKHYLPLLPPVFLANSLSVFVIYWRNSIPTIALAFILVLAWLLVAIRWRVLLSNLFWNATRCSLGHFVAHWDLRSYQILWLHNCLVCLFTLGLYWPWAKIHFAEYKAEHLAFFANRRYAKWKRMQTS